MKSSQRARATARADSRSDPRVWLSGAALDLYEHLDGLGEIERLRQMPRFALRTLPSPRVGDAWWDYVESVLRLAAFVPSLDGHFGGGEIAVGRRAMGTGRDLVQCWALLENYARPWGGFAIERLVLDALAAGGRARELFLQGMPTDADRTYAAWVVDHHIPYRIGPPLAAGFLQVLPAHRRAPGRALWLAALTAICEAARYGDQVLGAYRAYRRLCRLAHFGLGMPHAGVPLSLDTAVVQQDPARYLDGFSDPQGNPLTALIGALARSLPAQFVAPDLVLGYALLQAQAGPWVQEYLESAASPEELFARLHALRAPQACPAIPEATDAAARREYVHIHRMHMPRPESVAAKTFSACVARLESRLRRRIGADSLVSVLAHMSTLDANGFTEHLLDFYVRPGIAPGDLARTLTAVCAQMVRPPSLPERRPGSRPCHGAEVSALTTALLSLMLPDTERMRIKECPAPGGGASVMLVHRRNPRAIQRQIEALRPLRQDPPRRHELEVLAASLRARPIKEFRAVFFCGFEIERRAENSPGDAEFDGAYLDVDARSATLYIVEAKSTQGSQGALRQLRRRLRRLGWAEEAQVVGVEGGAEAAVPVRLRRTR